MNLEAQVCSFEHATKLKELGVKQESYFYWRDDVDNEGVIIKKKILHIEDYWPYRNPVTVYDYYSAFTVAELGGLIPWEIELYKNDTRYTYSLDMMKVKKEFIISYNSNWNNSIGDRSLACKKNVNEANARAEMLIVLIENKLIDAEMRGADL